MDIKRSLHSRDAEPTSASKSGRFTELLKAAQDGDSSAENELFDLIDGELRGIAARIASDCNLARATSLVNEAYIYFFERIKTKQNLDLKNRSYFFASIANRMRNIMIDRIKKRHPGPWDATLDEVVADFRAQTHWEFELLHDALSALLKSEDPRQRRRHQLINLHFFCGLSYRDAARALSISSSQYQLDRDRALAELQLAMARHEQ